MNNAPSMPDREIPSVRYQALIQLLRTAEDLWNASRVFFSRWDLSPSQFNVLNLLRRRPEGLSQSELSRLLIMHRSNATGLVDRLESRGLVRREDDSTDRRAYRVVLASAGLALMEEIYPHYYAAADRVWAEIPDERVKELVGELETLAAHAGAVAVLSTTEAAPHRSRRKRRSITNHEVNSGPGAPLRNPDTTPIHDADSVGSSLRTSDL